MISIFHSNYRNFIDVHCKSVAGFCNRPHGWKKYRTATLDAWVKCFFHPVLVTFDDLLRASPDQLLAVKRMYDAFADVKKNSVRVNLNLVKIYNDFVGNKKVFSDNGYGIDYNSAYLAREIDIFTCPYCNENHTYNFKYTVGSSRMRRNYDWDHLYSQGDYPFLAICFFNLVPACKVCNFLKLDQNEEYFNPHSNLDFDGAYRYDVKPISPGFISDVNKIRLNIVFTRDTLGRSLKRNAVIVAQLERFRCHKETVKDILNKKRIYKNTYVVSLQRQVKILQSVSLVEIKKTIFGVYFDYKDYYKRPFSKLTSDILRGPFT